MHLITNQLNYIIMNNNAENQVVKTNEENNEKKMYVSFEPIRKFVEETAEFEICEILADIIGHLAELVTSPELSYCIRTEVYDHDFYYLNQLRRTFEQAIRPVIPEDLEKYEKEHKSFKSVFDVIFDPEKVRSLSNLEYLDYIVSESSIDDDKKESLIETLQTAVIIRNAISQFLHETTRRKKNV